MSPLLDLNKPRTRLVANTVVLAGSGGRKRPPLLDPSLVFPEAVELTTNFTALQQEVRTLIERRNVPRYGVFDAKRASEVSEDWRLYYVQMFRKQNPLAAAETPMLADFSRRHKHVVNTMVSILDPGVGLPRHRDPYAGILRYHLGITIPQSQPPYMLIGGQRYVWREGEGVVLDVDFEHEVIHEGNEARVIVIIDIRRPALPPIDIFNRYCLRLKSAAAPNFVDASKYDVMH